MSDKPDRAMLFVDGNNWYHAFRKAGIRWSMDISYAKISQKLVGPREWVGTRYYIGAWKQQWDAKKYADQRRFLSLTENEDSRISIHLGRLEERPIDNPMAADLMAYLEANHDKIPQHVRNAINVIAKKRRSLTTLKEKAVDVMLAVDLYRLAHEDAYDAAYLLSADGDFTPAVELVMSLGKKVYAAAPEHYSSALAKACGSFISLNKEWFSDLLR